MWLGKSGGREEDSFGSQETKFAGSGELIIAYQVVGDGPIDAIFVPGFMSHVELNWEFAFYSEFFDRLATYCRLIILDKRGTGLSDRTLGLGTLKGRMDDLRAVMDAVGLDRAVLIGISEGVHWQHSSPQPIPSG